MEYTLLAYCQRSPEFGRIPGSSGSGRGRLPGVDSARAEGSSRRPNLRAFWPREDKGMRRRRGLNRYWYFRLWTWLFGAKGKDHR